MCLTFYIRLINGQKLIDAYEYELLIIIEAPGHPWRGFIKNFRTMNRPFVGVAVIVTQNKKVLLGKRKGTHGAGSWAFPGGHLEFNESIKGCAIREVYEETGLSIKNCRYATFTNDLFKDNNKHYVTLYVVCEYESGEPEIKEPDKCEEWEWFFWNKFPKPLFLSLRNLLDQDFNPFIMENR